MKKILFLNVILAVTCLFLTSSLVAQSPQGIPYQAVMRNADGSVMASSAVSLTFMIHDGTANGTVVYQESHSLTSNAQGLVSCVVGNGVVSEGNFSAINWGSGAKFLHVMMGSTDLGTQQMLSVPYALHSSSADNAVNATNATNALNAQTAANGFSGVSQSGDTLYMANGTFIIVPGISAANFPPAVLGCTDNVACNYNSAATQNDNSCLYIGATCDDGNANTTNDVINGSCICAGTAVNNGTYVPGNGATDIDGNTYTSIIINGQEWMQQNLAVTKYRNGDPIPTGLSNTTWQNTTNGAYAIYNNDEANNSLYGKLYNWYAVNDSRGVCPTGWHVPSDAEWTTLTNNLGGSSVAGGKMKTTMGWTAPNTGATNESGFTGLPGGYRSFNGGYSGVGDYDICWSSSEDDSSFAWYRELEYFNSSVLRNRQFKQLGFSVRCVRD
jgi:uncharacterized protein (TIGR02145 family)